METHLLFIYSVDKLSSLGSTLGTIFFLYVSPDQILPLVSALGAIIGALLIVWHRLGSFFGKVWKFFSKK